MSELGFVLLMRGVPLFHSGFKSGELAIELFSSEGGVVAVHLGSSSRDRLNRRLGRLYDGQLQDAGSRHAEAERQLREYFRGQRRVFDFPIELRGSDFQLDVWRAVADIPYGRTASYGDIAHLIGRPKAFRAVGAANGANPLAIVVPCHRVLGSNGSLTGYGGGLPVKRTLLALEGQLPVPAVQMRLF